MSDPKAPSPGANRQLSAEEWAALDEDEGGELVDGLLEPEEMPDPGEYVKVVARCERALDRARALGPEEP